jgi:hypothetical protein
MFTQVQLDQLEKLFHDTLHQFVYQPDPSAVSQLTSQWEEDKVLVPAALTNVKFTGICESFARVCMLKVEKLNAYQARLVVCYDERGEGHCVCEVAVADLDESVIMDNRSADLVNHSQLTRIGYKFLGCSPWNPVPGDTRDWEIISES